MFTDNDVYNLFQEKNGFLTGINILIHTLVLSQSGSTRGIKKMSYFWLVIRYKHISLYIS